MPNTCCLTCFNAYWWRWDEAFDKFGFNDGDGQVMTETVVEILARAGYVASHERWGCHNDVIDSITKNGVEQIPESAVIGYHNPRDYLPKAIIDILDAALPEDGEAVQ